MVGELLRRVRPAQLIKGVEEAALDAGEGIDEGAVDVEKKNAHGPQSATLREPGAGLKILDDVDPIEWFVTAQTMNHDGDGLVEWMAAHPRLDRATALALYWHSLPGYHQAFASEEEVPDVNRSGWRVIHRLQERLTSGDLADHGLVFDPTDDAAGHEWISEARNDADAAWQIPEELFRALPGEDVDDEDDEDEEYEAPVYTWGP